MYACHWVQTNGLKADMLTVVSVRFGFGKANLFLFLVSDIHSACISFALQ